MQMNQWESMTTGDENAFLIIYEFHYQALFSYGFSLTANIELTKDCIQELFLEIWKKHITINKEVKNVRSYLFTWLRRKISKELARVSDEKNLSKKLESDSEYILPYEDLLIAFQQSEENKNKLRAALKKLTRKQLEIIRLKFYENLSYAEIAAQTSLTHRTVYNLIYEAIRHLRECMRLLVFFF